MRLRAMDEGAGIQVRARPAPFWTGRTQAGGQWVTWPPRAVKLASIAATSASLGRGSSWHRALWARMVARVARRAWAAAAAGESGRKALLIVWPHENAICILHTKS